MAFYMLLCVQRDRSESHRSIYTQAATRSNANMFTNWWWLAIFQKACLAVSPIWYREQMFLHASSVPSLRMESFRRLPHYSGARHWRSGWPAFFDELKKGPSSKFVPRSKSAAISSSDGSIFKLSISNKVEKCRKGNHFRSSWNHDHQPEVSDFCGAGSFRFISAARSSSDMISFLYRTQIHTNCSLKSYL